MSLMDLVSSKTKIDNLWRRIEDGAFDFFLQEIEAGLGDSCEGYLGDKAESLIAKLWELQLEQGFNTFGSAPFFYPRGTKFFYHTDQKTIIVVEQPPMVRTIGYRPKHGTPTRYTIALPYMIFAYMFTHDANMRDDFFIDKEDKEICALESCHCYFSNEPLKSMDTMVAIPALPNIHMNGNVCWGHRLQPDGQFAHKDWEDLFEPTSENLIDFVEESITFFWNSWFNEDINQHYNNNRIKTPILEFSKWAKATEKDPNFVLKINWLNPVPFKKVLMILPGSLENTANPIVPHADSFIRANQQLDDVYCTMMDKGREQVRQIVGAITTTDEFEGLTECFHAAVTRAFDKAHKQFLATLTRKIKQLPSYRRKEVENCIEESLEAAMMAFGKGRI